MTSPLQALPQSHRLSRASRCSITELSPAISDQASRFVDGVISLIWPYSSSTRSMAVLLADPDFRTRRAKGQTKVTFHGEIAVAVANSHVGIGDAVHLSLGGAQWAQSSEDVSVVGNRADWDLEYVGQVFMEIQRGMIPLAVVDVSPLPESLHGPLREIDGNGGVKTRTPRTSRTQELWPSPAFAKQNVHLTDPSLEVKVSSAIEEDGYIPGSGRKRTRFSRDSGSWRYLERSSSAEDGNQTPDHADPPCNQERVVDTTCIALDSDNKHPDIDAVDSKASQQPCPLTPRHHPATNHADKAPEALMPPPTLDLEQHQIINGPSNTKSPVKSESILTPQVERHLGAQHTPTPPSTSTPILRPLNSPGLPLISPLVGGHGGINGYFPPVSNAQSELHSIAEMFSQESLKGNQSSVTLPPTSSPTFPYQVEKSFSDDAVIVNDPHPAGQTVDLISPGDEAQEWQRPEAGAGLRAAASEAKYDADDIRQPLISLDGFDFVNDSPIELQPVDRSGFRSVPDKASSSTAEVTSQKSVMQNIVSSATLEQSAPRSPHKVGGDSNQAVIQSDNRAVNNSPTTQPSQLSTDQLITTSPSHVEQKIGEIEQNRIGYEDNLYDENKQEDIEQNHIISVPLYQPLRLLGWTEALEVSAHDVEDDSLRISAPPFPFKQGWDTRAKKQSEARQRVQKLQTAGLYTVRRESYDGAEEGDRSSSAEPSAVISSLDIRERSLFYDENANLNQREVAAPDERTEPESSDSALTDGDESILEAEGNVSDDSQIVKLESGKDHQLAVPELEMQPGRGPEQEDFSQSVDSDGPMINDEDGYQSPTPIEEVDSAPRLPEMPRSRSPSVTPEEDTSLYNASSTPLPQFPLNLHIEGHKAAELKAGYGRLADDSSLRQLQTAGAQVDQLATPDNTQEEPQNAQIRGSQNKLHKGKPLTELPPSPQNTQDLQEKEPLGANEERQKMSTGPPAAQPRPHLGESETDENLTTPFSEETRRRRSSRLSGKMSLLGKDPSEIVSPYFIPKRAIQDRQQDQDPSFPLRQPLSPSSKPRDNVVVLIPPPTEKRSEPNAQQWSVTPTPLTSPNSSLKRDLVDGKGFTTPHSYYPSLSSVPNHFHDLLDILAVASSVSKQPQRAKSGPKDYYVSMKLADSSCGAGDTLLVQLLRPYRNALPTCTRGDILLLRNMKVQTCPAQGTRRKSQESRALDSMMLLSTNSSAWAVFKFPFANSVSATEGRSNSEDGSARSPDKRGTPVKMDVQVSGPPVEFGAEERAFARGLNQWWIEEGEAGFPDIPSKPGQKMKRKGKEKLNELEIPEETLHEHELRDGMAYGDIISPRPLHEHFHRNENGHVEDHESSLHEHELRDGVAYGDTISKIPVHEHHLHEHQADHSYSHGSNAPRCGQTDSKAEDESSLHEHELRDGMAYGDTLSSKPIHRHFHVHEDHQDGQESSTSQLVQDGQNASLTSLASGEADRSHSLRNVISYGDTAPNRKSTLISTSTKSRTRSKRGVATEAPTEQSESESEAEAEDESEDESENESEGESEDESEDESKDEAEDAGDAECVHSVGGGRT
ncbi:hypothetical protein GJ744_005261 [Endocarpon pusillum]|uniref:Telomeric single stranded DNA binding POT1/Cdc13 domain-containing protein n=1 Tax=Endocarpon pusillum TaxID=364733 RepID=A0A8H7A7Q8_9EURO|nr:hypothetical protein GJ744_005261 [Endocarpon pusillum]